jgi:hypothetical protein
MHMNVMVVAAWPPMHGGSSSKAVAAWQQGSKAARHQHGSSSMAATPWQQQHDINIMIATA